MTEVDDSDLLERARRGDELAFSQLFHRHQGAIYRYAIHMCGAGVGEDVVQDTFLAVLKQRERTDPLRGSVAAYLFGIARHLVLQRLGAKYDAAATASGEDTSQIASGELTALDGLTRTETIAAVRAAIRSLPLVYREVVVLCELQDLSYDAAAIVLRCPIGTVRSRLARARALLAAKLTVLHSVTSVRRE